MRPPWVTQQDLQKTKSKFKDSSKTQGKFLALRPWGKKLHTPKKQTHTVHISFPNLFQKERIGIQKSGSYSFTSGNKDMQQYDMSSTELHVSVVCWPQPTVHLSLCFFLFLAGSAHNTWLFLGRCSRFLASLAFWGLHFHYTPVLTNLSGVA